MVECGIYVGFSMRDIFVVKVMKWLFGLSCEGILVLNLRMLKMVVLMDLLIWCLFVLFKGGWYLK